MRKKIRKVPATTNNITKGIVNFLLDKGHFVFRVNNGSVYDRKRQTFRRKGIHDPALSDVMGVLRPSGVFIAIEIKNSATGDKPKSRQKDFAREVISRGGIHYFAKTYEEFKSWYDDYIYDDTDLTKEGLPRGVWT